MNGFLIDSHAHLTFSESQDTDAIIKRAKKAKISKIINICTDQISLEKGILIKDKYDFIYNAAAVTPHDVEKGGASFSL